MERLQALLGNWRVRYDALPPNDRRALLVMFVAIALTVVYLSLDSSRSWQQQGVERYRSALEDTRWIALNEGLIRSQDATAAAVPADGSDASLINRATTSAKPFGIVFKRYQPEGETGLRLWIEGAQFDQFIRWIAALEKQGIRLDQLDIDKQREQPGIVDARVLLSR